MKITYEIVQSVRMFVIYTNEIHLTSDLAAGKGRVPVAKLELEHSRSKIKSAYHFAHQVVPSPLGHPGSPILLFRVPVEEGSLVC